MFDKAAVPSDGPALVGVAVCAEEEVLLELGGGCEEVAELAADALSEEEGGGGEME